MYGTGHSVQPAVKDLRYLRFAVQFSNFGVGPLRWPVSNDVQRYGPALSGTGAVLHARYVQLNHADKLNLPAPRQLERWLFFSATQITD